MDVTFLKVSEGRVCVGKPITPEKSNHWLIYACAKEQDDCHRYCCYKIPCKGLELNKTHLALFDEIEYE